MPASGSGSQGYIEYGAIAKPHGLKGVLRLSSFNPDSNPLDINRIWLGLQPEIAVPYQVESWEPFKDYWLVTLKSVDDRAAAQSLRGAKVWVERAQLANDDDGWFVDDLVGAKVVQETETGISTIGTISEFAEGGPQLLMVIHRGNREIYMPWVEPFVSGVQRNQNDELIVVLGPEAPVDL